MRILRNIVGADRFASCNGFPDGARRRLALRGIESAQRHDDGGELLFGHESIEGGNIPIA